MVSKPQPPLARRVILLLTESRHQYDVEIVTESRLKKEAEMI